MRHSDGPARFVPDFFLAGAPKCGTSSLWQYLRGHPDLCFASEKEPQFFSRSVGWDRGAGDRAPRRSGRFDQGWDWYGQLFSHCSPMQLKGEASTLYFEAPDSAELLREHVPNARLVFILRDPVDRIYSNYWQELKQGRPVPDFPSMLAHGHPRLEQYIDVSCYDRHLKRYLDRFSRERILILFTEDLQADRVTTVRRICSFLGVDTEWSEFDDTARYNEARMPRFPWLQRALSGRALMAVADGLPSRLRSWGVATRRRILRANSHHVPYPPLPPDQRAMLIERLEPSIAGVEELTGRSMAHWRRASAV